MKTTVFDPSREARSRTRRVGRLLSSPALRAFGESVLVG
jgi:hypothetical protein